MGPRRVPGSPPWSKPLPQDAEAVVTDAVARMERYTGSAFARMLRFMGMTTLEWEGAGAVVRDVRGDEYVDCGGYGMFFHGHRHPRVVEAVRRQAGELALSTRLLPNLPQVDLAERLAACAPGDLRYSFFCNSGAEAVEGALKLARAATGRTEVLAAADAFHGKTLGALSASGKPSYRDPFRPLVPGFRHVPFGDAPALAAAAADAAAAPGGLAAILLEPIQGEAGVVLPPPGYLAAARRLCDEHGALLLFDEVQTGLGRTGVMFAAEAEGIAPDVMALAKSLGGGVMPLGAFIATPEAWAPFDEAPFLHTSTFGGNPLACAAGVAGLEAIAEEALVARAAQIGGVLGAGLQEIAVRHPEAVAAVRGRGLLWGLDLRSEGLGGMVLAGLLEAGVLVVYSLNRPKVIRVMPPAVATEGQIAFVLEAVERAVRAAAEASAELI